jgi:hypothetical protein
MVKMVETSQSISTAEAIRTMLVQYMSGPTIDIVPLESRIPVNIESEAASKHCDFVLYSTLTLKKNGGTSRWGGTLKKVAPVAALIALSGTKMSNVASTVARVLVEVTGEVTSEIKKKDEITFEYRMVTIGGALPIVANKEKVKAKEDSEDVLSPMLAMNAEVVVLAAQRTVNDQIAARRKAAEQAAPPAPSTQVAMEKDTSSMTPLAVNKPE